MYQAGTLLGSGDTIEQNKTTSFLNLHSSAKRKAKTNKYTMIHTIMKIRNNKEQS